VLRLIPLRGTSAFAKASARQAAALRPAAVRQGGMQKTLQIGANPSKSNQIQPENGLPPSPKASSAYASLRRDGAQQEKTVNNSD